MAALAFSIQCRVEIDGLQINYPSHMTRRLGEAIVRLPCRRWVYIQFVGYGAGVRADVYHR